MKAGKEVFIAKEIPPEYLEENEKQPTREEIDQYERKED